MSIIMEMDDTGRNAQLISAVLAAENRRHQGLLDGNIEALRAMMHDDVVWINSSGMVESTTGLIRAIERGNLSFNRLEYHGFRLRLLGECAVLISGAAITESCSAGVHSLTDELFTMLWSIHGGSWKLLSLQFTAVASPDDAPATLIRMLP